MKISRSVRGRFDDDQLCRVLRSREQRVVRCGADEPEQVGAERLRDQRPPERQGVLASRKESEGAGPGSGRPRRNPINNRS